MNEKFASSRGLDLRLDDLAAAVVRVIAARKDDRDRTIAKFLLRLGDRLQDDGRPAPGSNRPPRAA
jgi:hypothetical protein